MTITIHKPIYTTDNSAYCSISKWQFGKSFNTNEDVMVIVLKDDIEIGRGLVKPKQWVKTAKLKEEEVIYRPDEPMEFYYNYVKFEPKKSKEQLEYEEFKKYLG